MKKTILKNCFFPFFAILLEKLIKEPKKKVKKNKTKKTIKLGQNCQILLIFTKKIKKMRFF